MQEIWKSFKLTDYDVSNLGSVLNRKTKRLLKPFLNDRYLAVDLFDDTVRQRVAVHRMVAIAFIENPENKEFGMIS